MSKKLFIILALAIAGCAKDSKTFNLKTIKLNDYMQTNTPKQKLYLKVLGEGLTLLAHTEGYPSDLTLPATFKVIPTTPMTLYSKPYSVQLWGDSTGYISSCRINMEEYKIIFPIDMEVKSDSLNVSIMGNWR